MHPPCRAFFLSLCCFAAACSPRETEVVPESGSISKSVAEAGQAVSEAGQIESDKRWRFVDIASTSGLQFEHWSDMRGELYFVEPVGAGGGLVDLDGDGDLDVVLLQGAPLTAPDSAKPPVFPVPDQPGARVFRNDLNDSTGGGRQPKFVDVTEESGFRALGYAMGMAAGDYDNDGKIDLYLANFGSNTLWRNVSDQRGIRFEQQTSFAQVNDDRWSTSASFVDIDADGWLDLYVTNYVDFRIDRHRSCSSGSGRRDYCGPQAYEGESDSLFRNLGDGRFEDISKPSGVHSAPSSGLGVVTADLDRDHRIDIYVAVDLSRNLLWRNLGSKGGIPRFQDVALLSGSSVSMDGRAQASMGIVAGDLDGDGDDDLFMTHLSGDYNTLYLNNGRGEFIDASMNSGMAAASMPHTGFGTVLIDVDNDSELDVVVANGEVRVIEAQALAGDPLPLKQSNQLLINDGSGRFEDVSASAGPEFARMEVSRAFALGDVNNDGLSDLLLTNNSGPARLLLNQSEAGHHWVGLRVLTAEGRDALGLRIGIQRGDGRWLWRRIATDGSYLAANDARVLVGLGPHGEPVRVRAVLGEGHEQQWEGLSTDRYHVLQLDTSGNDTG